MPKKQFVSPMSIAFGPKHGNEIGHMRATIWRYHHGGEFVFTDEWKTIANPYKPLLSPWVGVTMFTDKPVDPAVVEEVRERIRDW